MHGRDYFCPMSALWRAAMAYRAAVSLAGCLRKRSVCGQAANPTSGGRALRTHRLECHPSLSSMRDHAESVRALIAGSRSASFRRLNAHLFAPGAAVGGLQGPVSKSGQFHGPTPANAGQTDSPAGLASGSRPRARKRAGRAAPASPLLRVHLVSFRRPGRPLDDDNLRAGCKAVRDAIAAWFGLDDGERWIVWDYSQLETRGQAGLAVKIEAIPHAQSS